MDMDKRFTIEVPQSEMEAEEVVLTCDGEERVYELKKQPRERDVPKLLDFKDDHAWCPDCQLWFHSGEASWGTVRFCHRCGRALDWGDNWDSDVERDWRI